MSDDQKCEAPLWSDFKCPDPVTANRDGKWFCAAHDPVESALRVEEFQRKRQLEAKPDAAAIKAERDALKDALREVVATVNRNDRAIKHEAGSMVWIVKEELDRWAKALGEGR